VRDGVSGGVSKITGVRVYKQDVNGQWVLVNNQSAMGSGGNAIEVAAPANPGTNVALLLRPAGSNVDWNSINSSSLVRFGDVLRYDATGLPAGNYEYQVRTTGSDGATHVTGTGTLNLASPPLATIGTPITYGAAGAGMLSWQSPGDDVTQVLRYRQPGGQWATMTATSLGNGLYGVNTSSFGPAVYEFELLWTRAGDAGPFAHATGQLQKVAERAGYWVPQVNYPPIGVSVMDGIAGTQLGTDETGAPIYAKDENGAIIGAHSTKVLHWNAPNGNVQFLYRTAGGAWKLLQVVNFGRNEAGVTAYQEVDIGGLPPGSYEYQLVATDASGARVAQALGNLTVNPQSAGHYELRDVQVQVPVTVSPPDPARYIIGSTNARYAYPVVVGTDEAGNQHLGAHYAWQGNVVVGVPYYETQVVGYQQQWYTVQVPTQGPPITRGTDENGNTLYVHDEAGNIMHETIWVTEWRSQWVPVYGNVTIYPPDPNQYMTQAPKTVYSAPVMLGRDEAGRYILGSHYAWQGNVVVAVPYTEYQWQTQQQQVWVEGTTPPPSMESTTPPYTPPYYVGGAPAQYSVAVSTPPNSGSTSLYPSQAGGVLGQIAQINGDAKWVRSTVVQKLDRWGNVIEITDPRSPNWKTTYRYNANNQVIEERKPDANGYQSGDSPVTRVTYDRLGRQVSVTDANGNVNGTGYNAAGNVIADYHPDGSVSYGYNTFGEKISTVDALGHLTRYSYDNLGHLLAATHSQVEVTTVDGSNNLQSLGSQNLAERYKYDQAGRLLSQTNGAGETTWYSYDLHGKVISTKLNMGQTTSAAYDVLGKKIAEIDPNGATATWRYTYFGKLLSHTDIGGAVFTYRYDNAKQLISQASSRGQSIGYSYDAAGQMTMIRDYAIDQVTTYAYDLAGNHVREKTVQQGTTYQDNFLAYDALNRLRDVADGSVHITIDYDKVGNRTHIGTHTLIGDTSHDSNRFFQYDSMNRQVVVDAIDAAGNLGQQGHRLTYDANGNRTSDTYYGNQVVVAGGQRVLLGFEEDGTAVYDTTPVTYTRQQGMVTETYRYDAEDRIVSVVRDGVQIDHRNYDGAGRVTMTGPNGALPQGYAQKLNEGVEQGQTNGLETRINRYDQNGRLVHQRTLKSDNAAKTDIDYTAYDAAGNVLQYRMTDHEGGYTNTYNYTFARYDGYKEDTISGTSTKLNPGSTKSDYDVNGNLIRVTDSTKPENNRTFVNDANGHVLLVNQGGNVERELVVNGEVLGQHGVGVDKVTPRNSQGNPNFAQIADFEFGYQSIVSNYPNAAPGSYTVQSGDTLRSIARSAYGDSALWYQIADANGLASDSGLRVGQTLNIPNKAAGVHNDGGVFKPYDPSKIVGDKTPNLATPSAGSGGGSPCGMIGAIIVAVVVIVVAVVSQQYYLATYGAEVGAGAGAGAAAGSAAVGTGTATVGSAVTYTAGSMAIAGAVGGATGAIAGQLVGMAIGQQSGFDWKQVAMGAIGGAITGGLSGASFGSNAIGSAIVRGAMASALTQGIGVATGLQKSFSWRSVAASAIGSGVGAATSESIAGSFGAAAARSIPGAALSGAAASIAAGVMRGGRITISNVALDAFGNALNSSLAGSNSSSTGRTSQEQALAQARGNVMSLGSLYGNPDEIHYLSGTPTDGIFRGDAVLPGQLSGSNAPSSILLQQANVQQGTTVGPQLMMADATPRHVTGAYGLDAESREVGGALPNVEATPQPLRETFGENIAYEGSIRNLRPFESFVAFNPLGQTLSGMGSQIQGIASGVANVVLHPVDTAAAMGAHYANAYRAGHLGDTVLNDVGGLITGAVRSTPVGLIDATYRRDAAGGFNRIGGALVDTGMAVAPVVGPSALRAGAEIFGPTVETMAGRYPMVFGPRMSIVPDGPVLVDSRFPIGKAVTVAGDRAIDVGQSYEAGVRAMYGDASFGQRRYEALVNGQWLDGVADNVVQIAGKNTAIEAKYVGSWGDSLRNPSSPNGGMPWAIKEQNTMVEQAMKYDSAFDQAIYHTNSLELATHYSNVFNEAGIRNFQFVITPAIR